MELQRIAMEHGLFMDHRHTSSREMVISHNFSIAMSPIPSSWLWCPFRPPFSHHIPRWPHSPGPSEAPGPWSSPDTPGDAAPPAPSAGRTSWPGQPLREVGRPALHLAYDKKKSKKTHIKDHKGCDTCNFISSQEWWNKWDLEGVASKQNQFQ